MHVPHAHSAVPTWAQRSLDTKKAWEINQNPAVHGHIRTLYPTTWKQSEPTLAPVLALMTPHRVVSMISRMNPA